MYDEGKRDIFFEKPTIAAKWERYIRVIESTDIERARNNYQNSPTEENDIEREFIFGKGSMTHLLHSIPFMRYEDEARVIRIVKRCMEIGTIPKTTIRKIRNPY